jgi:hypothetical protein
MLPAAALLLRKAYYAAERLPARGLFPSGVRRAAAPELTCVNIGLRALKIIIIL